MVESKALVDSFIDRMKDKRELYAICQIVFFFSVDGGRVGNGVMGPWTRQGSKHIRVG